MSEIRPDMKAGPKFRHFNPLKSEAAGSLAATALMASPIASAAEKSLSVSPRTIVLLSINQRRLTIRSRITNAIRQVKEPSSG